MSLLIRSALCSLGAVALASVVATACSGEAGDDGALGETGSAELAIGVVPSDTNCLRVSAKGSRTVTRFFDLTPGSTPSLSLDRLPVGIVEFDAQGFGSACSAVGTNAVPAWILDAPLPVRIDPFSVTSVILKLLRNGRVAVSVDFEAPPWISTARQPVDFAVIGDTPYGALQIEDFPNLISDINAAAPSAIIHLGDIKNGSSRCDTSYFQFVLDNFQKSSAPLLFTPGDNEWTDCHRANNGAYDPLARLDALRQLFYPVPGLSLGVNKKQVLSQAFYAGFETFVENQLWLDAGVVFSFVHVVGSNNGLAAWYTDATNGMNVDDPVRRVAEVDARDAANLDWLERSFALAREQNAAAVAVLMQADMWDVGTTPGFSNTIQKLASLSLSFGKPVLVLQGDSHFYKQDNPLANGDAAHGVTTPVPNLTRVVVQGSNTTPKTEWLSLHVDPDASAPFSWTRKPR